MKNARFKIGDKVTILDGSKIKDYTFDWAAEMAKYVGQTAIIREIVSLRFGRYAYRLDGNSFTWDERGLAPVDQTVRADQTIVIYRKKGDVIALDKSTGKSAKATCSKDDTFDFYVGAKLAFERLMKFIPESPKFKVGDKVIGNKKANDRYTITKEGWRGTVTEVYDDGYFHAGGFNLDPEYFDLDTTPDYYSGKVVCVKAACGFTKGKIYEVKDGKLGDDDGDIRPSFCFLRSFDHMTRVFAAEFLEVTE